jgi:hypothetical protein
MNHPSCTARARHKFEPAGGSSENPGHVGIGGLAIRYTEQCAWCGCRRWKVFGDANKTDNRNHGWRYAG